MEITHKRGFAATFHQRHTGSIHAVLIEQVIDFLDQHYDAVWLSVSEETVPELKRSHSFKSAVYCHFYTSKRSGRCPQKACFCCTAQPTNAGFIAYL